MGGLGGGLVGLGRGGGTSARRQDGSRKGPSEIGATMHGQVSPWIVDRRSLGHSRARRARKLSSSAVQYAAPVAFRPRGSTCGKGGGGSGGRGHAEMAHRRGDGDPHPRARGDRRQPVHPAPGHPRGDPGDSLADAALRRPRRTAEDERPRPGSGSARPADHRRHLQRQRQAARHPGLERPADRTRSRGRRLRARQHRHGALRTVDHAGAGTPCWSTAAGSRPSPRPAT